MQEHTKTTINQLINEINRLRDLVDKDRFSISELEAELKRNQWQPIETAPKDGTQFLIWTKRVGFSVVRHNTEDEYSTPSELNPFGFALIIEDGKHGPYPLRGDYPTYWMPLPEPPKGDV